MDTDASLLTIEFLRSAQCTQARSHLNTINAEVPYSIYLEGCKPEDADALELLLKQTLVRIANEGIPQERIDNALHQLELASSEIGHSGSPFGLALFTT